MIKLKEVALPDDIRNRLAAYQQQINQEVDYELRREKARQMWETHSQSLSKVREILKEMTPSIESCCYCEDSFARDIEHFRPKTLYPNDTFVWENYLLACPTCNGNKKDKFAIFDGEGRKQDVTHPRNQPKTEPIDGQAVLINPRFENPLDFLRIDLLKTFRVQPCADLPSSQHERASYTIELLKLNRAYLTEIREAAFRNFISWGHTYDRYRSQRDLEALFHHQTRLEKSLAQLSVWSEMKRVYRNRNENWQRLTEKYSTLKEIDTLFNQLPHLLD